MNENEWISVEDSLPGAQKIVELKFKNAHIYEGKISFDNAGHIAFKDERGIEYYFENLTHWREIPEKRPDFSKLNEGDLINIEEVGGENICAYFIKICSNSHKEFIDLTIRKKSDSTWTTICVEFIKKITRINIAEKTFEEI